MLGGLLAQNIGWLEKHPECTTMPHLAVLVSSFQPVAEHIKATCKDASGVVEATIHAQVLEDFPQLSMGCAVLLRNVTVYRATRLSQHLIVLSEHVSNVWTATQR